MAEKTAGVERIYTIPLRPHWIGTPRVARAKRAEDMVRLFLGRHLHSENVKLSAKLHDAIWKRGVKKPPARIKVKAIAAAGIVKAMLPEETEIKPIAPAKGLGAKLRERFTKKSEKAKVQQAAKAESAPAKPTETPAVKTEAPKN
ncbi:MAG: 60S ribosomal protein L31 [Candidatus Aenigmarchaeota archaeon]|nr:60S ribosomal protein L31 [Candidatus Aenigmarchaeota archaeon]